MNITEFKTLLLAYAQRDPTRFLRGGVDCALVAINNAKAYAQRQVDFELARDEVEVKVDPTIGGNLSTARVPLSSQVVKIKTIEQAYLPSDSGDYFPVGLIKHNSKVEVLKRGLSGQAQGNVVFTGSIAPVVVRRGDKISIFPWYDDVWHTEPVVVKLDAVLWLPDYSTEHLTDFMLDECKDWMLYHSLAELNLFLKEGERIQIPEALAKDAWESLKYWNESLQTAKEDLSLD